MIIDLLWLILGAATFIQITYLLFIYGKLSFQYRETRKTTLDHNQEGVSIIIAAHNEEENLRKLIPLLFQQNYPLFEVLIINDRSTDGTRLLLAELMKEFPPLRTVTVEYTPEHVTAKKYALTLGIKVAKYDVLLLTDADCIPVSENWAMRMTSPIRNNQKIFSLGYGGYHKAKGFLNALIQYETWFTAIQYFSFALWKAPFMGVGRNLAYRRQYFMDQKAFKDLWQVLGGDDDLYVNKHAKKNNTAVVIHPEAITRSIPKTTFKEYYLQKTRHYQAGKYYKTTDKAKIGLYAISHLFFWATAIALISITQKWEPIVVIVSIIVTRALLQFSTFDRAIKKIEGQKKVLWIMFFDLMYLSYFWIIGAKGYLSKTVRWK
ncbi:glycosyltransferase [Echinicola strongylocentroti]|uniref:Glycosyltransferase n=1 Tax=Echinicola strongylocentroti TaxID=1795355 RepID=A0A2Z4IKM0_9BACT|nr:glycosyltransferase [Echinicola strongylocentroti]AWW31485.1 glycosyltransferase [Echinicola strongylocentroti]